MLILTCGVDVAAHGGKGQCEMRPRTRLIFVAFLAAVLLSLAALAAIVSTRSGGTDAVTQVAVLFIGAAVGALLGVTLSTATSPVEGEQVSQDLAKALRVAQVSTPGSPEWSDAIRTARASLAGTGDVVLSALRPGILGRRSKRVLRTHRLLLIDLLDRALASQASLNDRSADADRLRELLATWDVSLDMRHFS